MPALYARENCYTNIYGRPVCENDSWDNWVRWLVLGLVIAAAILVFFLFACITARRRRKMGYTPYRGTGWAAGGFHNNYNAGPPPENYYQQQSYYQSNQPAYNPPPAYGASGANNEYYGGGAGRNDVELQQPQPVYGGENVYQAPPGPPPSKR